MTVIKEPIFVGDKGVEVSADIGVSTTGLTFQEIKVKKPDKTETTWATTTEDATHILAVVDFSTSGVYTCHAYGEWTEASTHHGKTFTITVYELYTTM